MEVKVKLRKLAGQSYELDNGRNLVLFSYETVVAYRSSEGVIYRTNVHHSCTTTKHINAWLREFGTGTKADRMAGQNLLNQAVWMCP